MQDTHLQLIKQYRRRKKQKQSQVLPTTQTEAPGEHSTAEQPTASRKPQRNPLLGCSRPNVCHPAAAASLSTQTRRSTQSLEVQTPLFSTPLPDRAAPPGSGGKPSSLSAAEQFGCLFSSRQTVKSLGESRTQTDIYMLRQTSQMANLPVNATRLLLSTCINC